MTHTVAVHDQKGRTGPGSTTKMEGQVWPELNFKLSLEIRDTLKELGFTKPTPVQAATIPLLSQNKDVVVEAVTGSGKTLAFLIPILEILKKQKKSWKPNELAALIVSPTRELARQIGDALAPFLQKIPLKKAVFTGGAGDSVADINTFRTEGGNIMIGTPGRLEDLLTKYPDSFPTKSLEVLILDEADRLLDMGFERSLNNIISKLPKQRRTGLFSATMTNAVNELVRTGLRNPMKVSVKVESVGKLGEEQKIPESLTIYHATVEPEEKIAFLLNFLEARHKGKTIVYFGTCACVDYFAKAINQLATGMKFLALHGKMEHKRRTNVYSELLASSSAVLFCTDLAARGLDFPDIDLVIQFDAPQEPDSFVHRCGRTARSGRQGLALVILDPKEEAYVDFMAGRKVPMKLLDDQLNGKHTQQSTLAGLVKINSADREMYEKGLRAFVSYMRFYQEHRAKFIFQFKELDIGKLARAFGLLHLPKMPELRQFNSIDFTPVDVDVTKIKFKDKAREKQRKASLARHKVAEAQEKETAKVVKRKPIVEAWSEQKARKERRVDRRDKKEKKRNAIKAAKAIEDESEEDDLDDDYRALKKEKKNQRMGLDIQMSDPEDSTIDKE